MKNACNFPPDMAVKKPLFHFILENEKMVRRKTKPQDFLPPAAPASLVAPTPDKGILAARHEALMTEKQLKSSICCKQMEVRGGQTCSSRVEVDTVAGEAEGKGASPRP